MHFSAAAAMTPSGVPPMPKSTSAPAPGHAVAMAPKMSPSLMSRMRAPVLRTSSMSSRVAGPVEDDDGEVAHALALGLGDPPQVLRRRGGDVDGADGVGADGDLLHVDAGTGVEHRAPLADGDDRERVAPAERGQGGAVDGVDGDVGERRGAVADLLAVEEHGRFVLLALADDDDAVHRHGGQHGAHGLDGGAVGAVLVAPAHPARAGERGGLGDPHQLEGEVAIRAAGDRQVSTLT